MKRSVRGWPRHCATSNIAPTANVAVRQPARTQSCSQSLNVTPVQLLTTVDRMYHDRSHSLLHRYYRVDGTTIHYIGAYQSKFSESQTSYRLYAVAMLVERGSALCSPVPMFPGTYVPRTYVPRYLCSPVPMFPGTDVPRTYVPWYLCFPVPMFPGAYVPRFIANVL